MLNRRSAIAVLSIAGLAAGSPAWGAPPVYQNKGYAIEGYDPVAYFSGKPERGQETISSNWRNAMWLFASPANKAAFDADPERYAPQYGGHCSMSMTHGKLSSGSPTVWRVDGGKLYLNGNNRARDNWLLNLTQNIKDADWYWQRSYARL
ncbi:MAG: hypothetical protein KIS73_22800 [Enhydrobacter sp.]|nr:hypothetical protein [Enhydrobacter sp.]